MRIENKKVLAVKPGDDRYGMKVGDNWYNGFGSCPAKKGDNVSFDYEDNQAGDRVFHNIAKGCVVEIIIGKKPKEEPTEAAESPKGTENEQKRELAVKKVAAVLYNKREFEKLSFGEVCKIVDDTKW